MSAAVLGNESSTSTPNDPPPQRQGPRFKCITKRPPISNASPREWCRPLAPGVVPAYDLALELLEADSTRIKSEALVLREDIRIKEEQRIAMTIKETEDARVAVNKLDDELEALRTKLRILEVQAEANLPNVRWRVANAMRKYTSAMFSCVEVSELPSKRICRNQLIDISWNKGGGKKATWIYW